MEGHAVGVQPLEMMDRRHHALAAKAVERPEQHAIELAAAGVLEQGGKLLALARALAAAHAVSPAIWRSCSGWSKRPSPSSRSVDLVRIHIPLLAIRALIGLP